MERSSNTYNVRAVERAVQILSSFDDEHSERGVSEIAQATGLHKATAHRIIMTLLNCGFLERTADGEKVRLGLGVVELGLGALRDLDFRRAAFPYMEQLVERFDETCDLGIFDRGQVLYVEVVHSEHSLAITTRVGRRLPVHCTASGRVLLAFLPPQVVEPILSAPLQVCTEKTITGPARLREELEATRQRGYGLDDEEFEAGIRAVSAPVWDIDGNVIAALSSCSKLNPHFCPCFPSEKCEVIFEQVLSIAGPTNRITPERIPEMAQALIETASAISAHVLRR